jgi:hypothetical protein
MVGANTGSTAFPNLCDRMISNMNLKHARAYLAVIRAEEQRRSDALDREDPNFAYDEWLFTDGPFIGELCLIFLVAIRHHIERQLLHFAACAADNGRRINRAQYRTRVDELQRMPNAKRWSEVEKRLSVHSCSHDRAIEALRLLANAYKHDPRKQPAVELLTHLGLNCTLTYADLSESGELQKGLARIVGLADNAGHCEIAERFVERVEAFLADVQTRTKLSIVNWGRVSNTDFAH